MHVILHPLCLYNAVTCPRLQDGDCFFTRLLKIDVVSKTSQEWKEEGTYPGEPIFVPHPEASQEDQGVLLSVVLAGQFCICDILVSFAPCCVCNVLVAFVPKFCESMREGCCMFCYCQTSQQNVNTIGSFALCLNICSNVACYQANYLFDW